MMSHNIFEVTNAKQNLNGSVLGISLLVMESRSDYQFER